MRKILLPIFTLFYLNIAAQVKITSPDKNIVLQVVEDANGNLQYSVNYKNKPVILPSSLGFKFSEPNVDLRRFSILKTDSSMFDETWPTVWGEYSRIRNHYRELRLQLKDKGTSGILMNLVFRVFNEGVGFRYEFPTQEKLNHFVIADEYSGFRMTGDHKTIWIPGDYDSNEFMYTTSTLSEVDATGGKNVQEIYAKTFF